MINTTNQRDLGIISATITGLIAATVITTKVILPYLEGMYDSNLRYQKAESIRKSIEAAQEVNPKDLRILPVVKVRVEKEGLPIEDIVSCYIGGNLSPKQATDMVTPLNLVENLGTITNGIIHPKKGALINIPQTYGIECKLNGVNPIYTGDTAMARFNIKKTPEGKITSIEYIPDQLGISYGSFNNMKNIERKYN